MTPVPRLGPSVRRLIPPTPLSRKLATQSLLFATGSGAFLTGSAFALPDAYLFVIQRWGAFTGFDLSPFPNIVAHAERVMARPAVQLALDAEK